MKHTWFKMVFMLLLGGSAIGATFKVEFMKLTDGVWIHRSYAILGGYKMSSNGLIIETSKSAILIDTAWDNEETEQIIRFIKETIEKPIAACFITHSHDDRAGGIKAISDGDTPLYMTTMTFDLLGRPDHAKRYHPILNDSIKIDDVTLHIDYFGPAHAPDNITIWEPKNRLLFCGCLVKPIDSKNLGSVMDADLKNWPIVIRKIQEKYKDIKTVIPGHGEVGDRSLLDHTLKLLGAPAC